MILSAMWQDVLKMSNTRTRGGDPGKGVDFGSTSSVIPARAGVILELGLKNFERKCYSRASGGDPAIPLPAVTGVLLFPRERG